MTNQQKKYLLGPRAEYYLNGVYHVLYANNITHFIKKFCNLHKEQSKSVSFSDLKVNFLR